MTKFNLQAAKASAAQAVTDRIDQAGGGASNQFDDLIKRIANNKKLTPEQKALALESLQANATKFVTAVLNGQTPALGTGGAPAPSGLQAALDTIKANVPEGQYQLVRRAVVPDDPGYIEAKDDGTPKAVSNLQKQIKIGKDERDLLDYVLTQIGISTYPAGQTYDVNGTKPIVDQALAARGVDPKTVVSKADLATAAAAARTAVDAITGGVRPGIVIGKPAALAEVDKIADMAK